MYIVEYMESCSSVKIRVVKPDRKMPIPGNVNSGNTNLSNSKTEHIVTGYSKIRF
jgi:hypothetical protein